MNLELAFQGVKGTGRKWGGKKGRIEAFIENGENCITIDAYQGSGDTYKERETPEITIVKDGKHYTFNSLEELVKAISTKFYVVITKNTLNVLSFSKYFGASNEHSDKWIAITNQLRQGDVYVADYESIAGAEEWIRTYVSEPLTKR